MTRIPIQSSVNPPGRDDVRERILDAAERLLERFGYRKTTVEDIAREAGIGKGTTYLHFRSKEEVFLGTIDRVVDAAMSEMTAVAQGNSSLKDRLQQMLVARVMVRFDRVQRYPASLDDLFVAIRPAYLRRRERYFADEAEVFAHVLAEAFPVADVGERLDVARTLLVATNGLLPYGLGPDELGSRADVFWRATRLAEVLVRGVLDAGSETTHP